MEELNEVKLDQPSKLTEGPESFRAKEGEEMQLNVFLSVFVCWPSEL